MLHLWILFFLDLVLEIEGAVMAGAKLVIGENALLASSVDESSMDINDGMKDGAPEVNDQDDQENLIMTAGKL